MTNKLKANIQPVMVVPPFMDTTDVRSGGMLGIGFYLRILRIYKWWILLFATAGMCTGMLIAAQQQPVYRAGISLVVEPELSNLATIDSGIEWDYAWRFYATQSDILKSQAIAERVVDQLGLLLRNDFEQSSAKNNNRIVVDGVDKIKNFIRYVVQLTGLNSKEGNINIPSEVLSINDQQAQQRETLSAMIRAGLTVKDDENTQIINVFFEHQNAQFSAEVANAVGAAYIDLGLEARLNRAQHASGWLTDQIEELRNKVDESETLLHKFQSQEGMLDVKSRDALTSSELEVLHSSVLTLQAKFAELEKRYGPKHPKIVSVVSELKEAKAKFEGASKKIVENRRLGFLLTKLEREVATNHQLYEMFVKRYKEADLAVDQTLSNVRVLDKAKVPKYAYRPYGNRNVGIWLLIGLSLGLLFAVIRDKLDNTFKTADEIENILKIPTLGAIPLLEESKGSPWRYYFDESKSPFAESINNIRTGILYSNVDRPPRTILVTSAIQGEGKSTLCSNLALAFSQLGRTILIDADLRKPSVGRIVETEKGPGLVDFVAGKCQLKDCVARDHQCENLYILRSGTIPPNPLELLSSDRFTNSLEYMAKEFSHVVVDTAPVLPVSDAIVLGQHVDEVILVVQNNRTTHAMVKEANKRLNASNVSCLGVVLSQVSRRDAAYYQDPTSSHYYKEYYGST